MMIAKYKKGDIVRIKTDLNIGQTFSTSRIHTMLMVHGGIEPFFGMTTVIKDICDIAYTLEGCAGYLFCDEMLEQAIQGTEPTTDDVVVF